MIKRTRHNVTAAACGILLLAPLLPAAAQATSEPLPLIEQVSKESMEQELSQDAAVSGQALELVPADEANPYAPRTSPAPDARAGTVSTADAPAPAAEPRTTVTDTAGSTTITISTEQPHTTTIIVSTDGAQAPDAPSAGPAAQATAPEAAQAASDQTPRAEQTTVRATTTTQQTTTTRQTTSTQTAPAATQAQTPATPEPAQTQAPARPAQGTATTTQGLTGTDTAPAPRQQTAPAPQQGATMQQAQPRTTQQGTPVPQASTTPQAQAPAAPQQEEASTAATGADVHATATTQATASRSVTIKSNQYLDITYPGAGWIYLGESDETNLMRYFGRKIGDADTTFSLRSKEEGTTLLHFYKNDALTGQAIDDYLSVTVAGINDDASLRVTAPDYAQAVPAGQRTATGTITYVPAPTPAERTQAAAPAAGTTTQATASSAAGTGTAATAQSASTASQDTDALLTKAQEAYDGSQYDDCLGYLTEFFNSASTRLDEALYLQGQALEAPSASRNIKAALDTYETLVRRYPQSTLWKQANDRIVYLQRFYFTIR